MDAVKAGVASVMCSYNKVNGTWACESDALNNKLMKEELGFPGYIMSDWNAQHSTVNSAVSGLDMTMPGSDFSNPPGSIFWGSNLEAAVADGYVPQSRLDDMVTRILAAWYLVGQDQGYPPVAFSSWNGGKANVDVTADHGTVARAVARDSIVLLKNGHGTLPLRKPKSLAIVGSDAIVNPAGPNACSDRGCNNGTLAMGWGSGTAEFPVSYPLPSPHTHTHTLSLSHTTCNILRRTVSRRTPGRDSEAGCSRRHQDRPQHHRRSHRRSVRRRGRRNSHRLHQLRLGRRLHHRRGQPGRPQQPGPLAQRQRASQGRRRRQQERHRRHPQRRPHHP